MPTITVQRQDLYRLAGLEIDYPLAALDEKLTLVKGELNSRTHDGIDLRRANSTWQVDSIDHKLRIELADTNRPDLWSVEALPAICAITHVDIVRSMPLRFQRRILIPISQAVDHRLRSS